MLKRLESGKLIKGWSGSLALPSATVILLLLAGIGITVWGLYTLVTTPETASWRWTHRYLVIFSALVSIIALVGIWQGSRVAGFAVASALAVGFGALVPVSVVAFLALSAYASGRLLLRSSKTSPTDNLLVGIVLFGTILSLIVHLPINNAGTWGLLFALPLLSGWRHVRELWSSIKSSEPESVDFHLYFLHCAIAAAALLHFLVGLMPEGGHDALAMHLFVPGYVAHNQFWHFDASLYVWAVMPMLVDWLYTAGYLFAGETGARLVNCGSIMLLASLVYRTASWAGANRISANWAVLLLLVTPLTFAESSKLFIEGMWSVLVMGGSLAVLRLVTQSGNARREIILAGLLLGGALAAKAVTFTVLPILIFALLIVVRHWFSRNLLPVAGLSLLIFCAVGAIPYVVAYILTGNPVFPFFNAYFQSPLYPAENFSAAAFFEQGFNWNTMYQMTFNSGRYLEATAGAAGFQWLLLILPGTLVVVFAQHRRALLLVLLGAGWLLLTFGQTAYLRYVFPAFALACALIAVFLTLAKSAGKWAQVSVLTVALLTVMLNLLHFHSGTYNGKIDLRVIVDARVRDGYIDSNLPLRSAVELVNELNRKTAPVAFFSAPLTAGLKADALYVNWYNPRFQKAVLATTSPGDMGQLLAREGVEYFVVDDSRKKRPYDAFLALVGSEVAKIGSVSVLRIDDRFRYQDELLTSTTFQTGWEFAPGAFRLADGSVQVSVVSPGYSVISARPGGKYRYTANARCADSPAKGRLQVNWLDSNGKFLRTDIDVFDCAPKGKSHSMDIIAPLSASHAVVYATSHEKNPVIFTEISFRN